MANEREINWKQVFDDAQATLDAQRRGEIASNETLVTTSGKISSKDLDSGEWVTIPDRGRIKVVDDPGKL